MAGDGEDRHQSGGAAALTFNHTGRALAMVGLCFKILLLSLVTLTIYRFWGRTEVRRYLWGHAVIDGEPLDYLGKGSELLIGFLIALLVYLFPLGAAFQAVMYVWPPTEMSAKAPLSGLIFFSLEVGFLYLLAVGLYQALRYRLSRTAWHGVRFALKGSAFKFGVKFLFLGFLNLVTAGLLTPVMDISLFRTIATNTYFGDKPFRFEGKARALYGPFLLTYLLIILIFAGLIGMMVMFGMTMNQTGDGAPVSAAQILSLAPYLYAGVIAVLLLSMMATAFYAARSLRVKGSGLRFEGLSLTLEAHTFSYLWLTISNLVLVTLSFGIALPVAELRRFRYIFQRLSSEGTVDLGRIGQSTGPVPRFGEGLAEAFGFGNV